MYKEEKKCQHTLLPVYAPMVQGVDPAGNPYILYTSTILLSVADDGGWITPLTGTEISQNVWKFETNSPFLGAGHQLNFTLSGSFSGLLETEYLFTLADTTAFDALAAFDNLLTSTLNSVLSHKLDAKKALFGNFVQITPSDSPSFGTDVTVDSFLSWYGDNYSNWPAQFLGLLQVYQWALVNSGTNTTAAALVETITPIFLHFKTNLYNLNRQVFFLL